MIVKDCRYHHGVGHVIHRAADQSWCRPGIELRVELMLHIHLVRILWVPDNIGRVDTMVVLPEGMEQHPLRICQADKPGEIATRKTPMNTKSYSETHHYCTGYSDLHTLGGGSFQRHWELLAPLRVMEAFPLSDSKEVDGIRCKQP